MTQDCDVTFKEYTKWQAHLSDDTIAAIVENDLQGQVSRRRETNLYTMWWEYTQL